MSSWAIVAVIAIIASRFAWFARYRYGQDRFNRGRDTRELEDRLNQVEQELQSVRQELTETQERVDFTERLLAKQKDTGKLGA